MRRTHLLLLCLVALGIRAAEPCFEHLDRGLVAVRTSSGVFLSWRLLDTDSENVSFYVLRDGTPVRSSAYTVKTTGGIVNTTFTDQIVVNANSAVSTVSADEPSVVYSLDGRRVLMPENGKIYIVGGRKRRF